MPGPSTPALNIAATRAQLDLELGGEGQMSFAELVTSETIVSRVTDNTPIFSMDTSRVCILPHDPDELPTSSSRLAVAIHGPHLPVTAPAPFNSTVQEVRFAAEPPIPSRNGSLPATLEEWRFAGGRVEVHTIEIKWPPFAVTASGTIALDRHLQPVGAFSARFQGFFEVLDALVVGGAARNRDASTARVVLGILARSPPGGDSPEISISVTAQDQNSM